jgi:hypothetical protein
MGRRSGRNRFGGGHGPKGLFDFLKPGMPPLGGPVGHTRVYGGDTLWPEAQVQPYGLGFELPAQAQHFLDQGQFGRGYLSPARKEDLARELQRLGGPFKGIRF